MLGTVARIAHTGCAKLCMVVFAAAAAAIATPAHAYLHFSDCGGQLLKQWTGEWVFWGRADSSAVGGLAYLNESSYQQGLTTASFTRPRRLRSLESLYATPADPAKFIYCSIDGDTAHATLGGGALLGWGKNESGQIGTGDTVDRIMPTVVTTPQPVRSVAAGGGHTLALMLDYTVSAWGANSAGQVGDGTTVSPRPTPALVAGLDDPRQLAVFAIAAGADHSVALLSDGTVKTWGGNAFGQLGIGNTISQPAPVTVGGLTRVRAIAAGRYYTVALDDSGLVWAWGFNGNGELGNGVGPNQLVPVRVGTLPSMQAITTTGTGTTFALSGYGDCSGCGQVWAWGNNSGANNTLIPCGSASCTPTLIDGLGRDVRWIFASAPNPSSAAAFAMTNDGRIFGWGSNYHNELGRGRLDYTSEPSTFAVPQLVHQDVTPSDFNRDYTSDILLVYGQGFRYWQWTIRDAMRIEDHLENNGDLTFRIVGLGDADGDGKVDRFYRDVFSGANSVKLMDNSAVKRVVRLIHLGDLNWKVAAIADLNGDGRADMLWRNEPAGWFAVWLIGPSGVTQTGVYAGVPSNWAIAGAADFDGDAKADIIWRDRNTGAVAIYRMDGVTVNGVSFLAGGLGEWDIVAVTDLDRDGYAEILFRHYSGAALGKVDLNPTAAAIETTALYGAAGSDWHLVAVGDYDADSHIDYLWRDSTGELVIWRLVNLVLPGSTDEERLQNVKWLGNPGNAWQVIGK